MANPLLPAPARKRRLLLATGAGLAAGIALPRLAAAAPIARLALYGPPAGPSIVLAHAVATGALAELASAVTLTVWRSPDELRAGLTSGSIDLSVVPTQVAANLYNRGMGLRLVNTMTDGLLYLVAPVGSAGTLADLAGKRVAVPYPNDTPDFVLRALLARQGLTDKVTIVSSGSPIEAAQMLLAGRIDAALLSEPSASAAVLRSAEAPRQLARVIDIQAAWGESSPVGPVLPQAGLAATRRFVEQHGALIAPLQAALERVTRAVIADPAAAAANATGPLQQPAPLLAASIPHSRLAARPARSARPAIEAMLTLMAGRDAAVIGGKLPDDDFYAL